MREFACVEVAGHPVALDVRDVREILRDADAARLPGAPALIEGVVDLRGRLLPLLDLGRLLGQAPTPRGPGVRIAVVEAEGAALALRVGAGMDVVAVELADVRQGDGSPAGLCPVAAWLRRAQGPPVPVLAVPALLDVLRRAEADEAVP